MAGRRARLPRSDAPSLRHTAPAPAPAVREPDLPDLPAIPKSDAAGELEGLQRQVLRELVGLLREGNVRSELRALLKEGTVKEKRETWAMLFDTIGKLSLQSVVAGGPQGGPAGTFIYLGVPRPGDPVVVQGMPRGDTGA
jgi:hypothetical protein